MIKSENQYKITKSRLEDFEAAINEFDLNDKSENVSASGIKAAYDALKSLRDELTAKLREFESLKANGISAVKFDCLADLPCALVQTRIARNVTQKYLADTLDVAPQQIQRWERDNYENTGLAYVLEVGDALGFDEVIRGCRVYNYPLMLDVNTTHIYRHYNVGKDAVVPKSSTSDAVVESVAKRTLNPRVGIGLAQIVPSNSSNLLISIIGSDNKAAVRSVPLNELAPISQGQSSQTRTFSAGIYA